MTSATTANESRRLLLVEDDAATRRMIGRHLRRSGFEVVECEAAESVATAESYDVVVSDVHLPGASGIELAARLLSGRPSQPIVLMTGDPDEALARDALARGPVSYLLKPFELVELDTALEQVVLGSRQRTAGRAALEPLEAATVVPEHWLRYLDVSSYAGPGHSHRVARIAERLASLLPSGAVELSAAELKEAAALHEAGRLVEASAEPAVLAERGAGLLRDLGCSQALVCAVRHMHERWDGSGGPSGLAGWEIPTASLILGVADGMDHYAAAWRQAGVPAAEATDRAIGLVLTQQGTAFSPLLANAVRRERAYLQQICTTHGGGAVLELFGPVGRSAWLAALAG